MLALVDTQATRAQAPLVCGCDAGSNRSRGDCLCLSRLAFQLFNSILQPRYFAVLILDSGIALFVIVIFRCTFSTPGKHKQRENGEAAHSTYLGSANTATMNRIMSIGSGMAQSYIVYPIIPFLAPKVNYDSTRLGKIVERPSEWTGPLGINPYAPFWLGLPPHRCPGHGGQGSIVRLGTWLRRWHQL